jgi:hypothetical protein
MKRQLHCKVDAAKEFDTQRLRIGSKASAADFDSFKDVSQKVSDADIRSNCTVHDSFHEIMEKCMHDEKGEHHVRKKRKHKE